MKDNYKKTMLGCFIGCAVQAVINNFAPLLFLTFQKSYGIPLAKITMLIAVNFGVQLLVDMLAIAFADKIGYRLSLLLAHGFAAAGLVFLALLPELLADPFAGLLIAVVVYAVGGGILEVLVSPVMEGCPTENKEKAMSLLHSFYCWGHVGVVLLSTAFFALAGLESWKTLALLWAAVPAANAVLLGKAPMAAPVQEGERGLSLRGLFSKKLFWVLLLMMLCAGAGEQAVSQWASVLAEKGLGVSKTVGDMAGPMTFAALMGGSRLFYGKFGERMNLDRFMTYSGALCIASYLLIVFAPVPALGFAGCALCGLSVGILWPGTFSKASALMKNGGTAMFALLALAGDLGCAGGPTVVGLVSHLTGGGLKPGILAAAAFPLLLLLGISLCRTKPKLSKN